MIKSLYLKNIFLFEEETINFENNLNIITGETGSGKSTIIKAIGLVLGDKFNAKMINSNHSNAIIEVTFDITKNSFAKELLTNHQMEFDTEILVRRELYKTKKSRFFINDQLISSEFLEKLSSALVEIVSQSSNHSFLSPYSQLKIIDSYANLIDEAKSFKNDFLKLTDLNKTLSELIDNQMRKKQEKALIEDQLKEIKEVNLLENEEEELKQEHSYLANSHLILEKLNFLYYQLIEDNDSVSSKIMFFQTTLSELEKFNSKFKDSLDLLKNISIELDEVIHDLLKHKSNIEPNPHKLFEIEQRLAQINKIQKKYGNSFEEIQEYKNTLENKLNDFEDIDEKIAETKKSIEILQELCNKKAQSLSKKRKKASLLFSEKVIDEIKSLNMPNANFEIDIKQTNRSSIGDDQLNFLFSANLSQKPTLLKTTISGGELSRVILSIKTIQAQNDYQGSIIFDEIDANVGGTTATILAQKLKNLANSMQVITITHFVQVAKYANNHYLAYKTETDKSLTKVKKLSDKDKNNEYDRMIGITS